MKLQFRKRILFFVLLGMLFIIGGSLFAQDTGNTNQTGSDNDVTLVRTYNIRKVYSYRLGYRLDVQDYLGRIRTIYAKISWFADPEQRDPESENFEVAAIMNYLPRSYGMPSNYLTLKYEGGELMDMVIYIDEPNYSKNSIWAPILPTDNIDDKFNIKKVMFSDPPPIPVGPMPEPSQEQDSTEEVQN